MKKMLIIILLGIFLFVLAGSIVIAAEEQRFKAFEKNENNTELNETEDDNEDINELNETEDDLESNRSCVGKGGSLGAVIPNNTIECCPGLVAYVPEGILGTRGTCIRPGVGNFRKAAEGDYTFDGKRVRFREENRKKRFESGNFSAEVEVEIEEGRETENGSSVFKVNLSNGRRAIIKIMPDTASERALVRLRIKVCNESNNCTIVLKEVGKDKNKTVSYELRAKKKARILGFIRARMNVEAQIDAETGEVIKIKKPWWAVISSEEE